MKPFIRKHRSGVSRIVRENYNTNQFGEQEKAFWWKISKQVRDRDQNRCIWCGAQAKEVHHIKPLSRGGTTTLTNLACICEACHNKRHLHLHASRGSSKSRGFQEPF